MFVENLRLCNYRNHRRLEIKNVAKINLITGPNAAGKSNLVEALIRFNGYNKQKENIIMAGEDSAIISAEVSRGGSTARYRLEAKGGKDQLTIAKKQPLGPLPIVHFAPDQAALFGGQPQERRSFLDAAIAVFKKKYRRELLDYQRAVRQKNNLLREDRSADTNLLESFNGQLAEKGALLIKERLSFLKEIEPLVEGSHRGLAENSKPVKLVYKSKTDPENIFQSLQKQMREHKELEFIRGRCLAGPHRDDFSVLAGGVDVSEMGSHGEKKTACLALKIAQIDLLRSLGTKPLLILDDALSELDPQRRQLLMDTIPLCEQTFITATDVGGLLINKEIKHIKL